jgi:hypothetical protein
MNQDGENMIRSDVEICERNSVVQIGNKYIIVCLYVCVRACVRACVCVCTCVRKRAYACVCECDFYLVFNCFCFNVTNGKTELVALLISALQASTLHYHNTSVPKSYPLFIVPRL